jgi:hypothetical protein
LLRSIRSHAWIGAMLEDLMERNIEQSHVTTTYRNDHRPAPAAARDVRDRSDSGRGNSWEDLDRRLDEALTETFPASDPVSVIVSGAPWDGEHDLR